MSENWSHFACDDTIVMIRQVVSKSRPAESWDVQRRDEGVEAEFAIFGQERQKIGRIS